MLGTNYTSGKEALTAKRPDHAPPRQTNDGF